MEALPTKPSFDVAGVVVENELLQATSLGSAANRSAEGLAIPVPVGEGLLVQQGMQATLERVLWH